MNTIKITPKDFFLHIGATVALYASAVALINLLFSVINYFFPDALAGYFYGMAVAWPISMLVVSVPVLYLLEWLISRDMAQMPEKKELWIRKWRIFFTLFVAAVAVGGDLIALVYNFLNGEISTRFILKIVAVILVSGTIGKYYFFSLYENFKWSKMARTVNKWFGLVLVLAAIILGFWAFGSPMKQRDLRFDTTRVSDLQNIQWQILNSWQVKGKLPATLDDLKDPLYGSSVPTDPETKAQYGYSVKSETSFELCADFARDYEDTRGRGEYGGAKYAFDMSYPSYGFVGDENWKHTAGRSCFVRTIDPDRSPKPEPLMMR